MENESIGISTKNMNYGKVSVIMPAYNAAGTIRHSVHSVKQQTYVDWELLIIDDASVDDTSCIIKKEAKTDERIRVLSKDKNVGVAKARNAGIEISTGRYLAFLDADDVWEKEKLKKQLSFMERNSSCFSYTACGILTEKGKRMNRFRHVPKQISFETALFGNPIPCLTVMIDLERLKKRYPQVTVRFPDIGHEDYALWLDVLKAGVIGHGLDEVLGYYRRGTGISRNKFMAAGWTYRIYREYLSLGRWGSFRAFVGYAVRMVKRQL